MRDIIAPNLQRVGDWIQTAHGVAFYPLHPRPEEILIEDIAHALSMLCRFTGHVRRFYSVAQHCVHVSQVCEPQHALWGLLHDASEAYLNDISRPMKRSAFMAEYKSSEKLLLSAITEKFGLSRDEPPNVKHADTVMLGVEARDLMSPLVSPERWAWCTDLATETTIKIRRTWTPAKAEQKFLRRFAELTRPVKPVSDASVKRAASILGRAAAERRREIRANSDNPLPLFQKEDTN